MRNTVAFFLDIISVFSLGRIALENHGEKVSQLKDRCNVIFKIFLVSIDGQPAFKMKFMKTFFIFLIVCSIWVDGRKERKRRHHGKKQATNLHFIGQQTDSKFHINEVGTIRRDNRVQFSLTWLMTNDFLKWNSFLSTIENNGN